MRIVGVSNGIHHYIILIMIVYDIIYQQFYVGVAYNNCDQIFSLLAHFTYCSSFKHNYLIIHPIFYLLSFNELSDHFARDLCYHNSDKNESL